MPWYLRHTSRFHDLSHAKCLMRVRCCSTNLAACPTNHAAPHPTCMRCPLGEPETAEHVLLDCPHTAPYRASERFTPLFMGPMPQAKRLRVFMHTPHQYILAKYVKLCLDA